MAIFQCAGCRKPWDEEHDGCRAVLGRPSEELCCNDCALKLERFRDEEYIRVRPCPDDAELLCVSGEFRLVQIREDGEARLAIEQRGMIFLEESNGDWFHDFVGIYFGSRFELAVALSKSEAGAGRPED